MPLCAFNGIFSVLACRDEQCGSQGRGTAKCVTCIIIELATRGIILWPWRLHFNSFYFFPHSHAVLLDPRGISQGEICLSPRMPGGMLSVEVMGERLSPFLEYKVKPSIWSKRIAIGIHRPL